MKPVGQRVSMEPQLSAEDLKREDSIVFAMITNGANYLEVGETQVQEGTLTYCKDAYKNDVKSECYIRKTDVRTIKQCAYEDAKSKGNGIVVISRHVAAKGTRRYYVSSWPSFVKSIYPGIRGVQRSFYENIYLEDPCRLYVDIDLDISDVVPAGSSPEAIEIFDRYTEALHQHVVAMVCALKRFLEALYDVAVTDVFFIDSSSHSTKKRKFSHHLIFHLDGDETFFKNSGDLLHLFNHIEKTSLVCEAKGIDQSSNPFFWPSDVKDQFAATKTAITSTHCESIDVEGEEEEEEKKKSVVPLKNRKFITDISVFGNSSREFRIVGSTKYGENRHFILMEHLHFENPRWPLKSVNFKSPCLDFDTFGRLLVCFRCEATPTKKLLTFEPKNKLTLNNFMASLIVKDTGDNQSETASPATSNRRKPVNCHDRVIEDDFCTTADMKENYEKMPAHLKRLFNAYSDEKRRGYVFEIIANDIMKQNPQLSGETVDWTRYVTRDGSFAVSFRTSSKYCEIKGDEHGNNHVFYVVWLRTKEYYQRCWNPECCHLRDQQWTASSLNKEKHRARDVGTVKKEEEAEEDDVSGDGDAENDGKREESINKIYEDNKDVRTCKSNTKLLSSDTWEIIQEYLTIQIETIHEYKRFRNGAFDASIRAEAACNYEVVEEIDLSQDDVGGEDDDDVYTFKYEPTERFKVDPILNDLFPGDK